jgi:hypothetical protein
MEKKKTFNVLAAFSQEASLLLDTDRIQELVDSEELTKGIHWDIKEFDTKAEALAYINGIDDANGWNDPYALLL